MLRLAFAFVFVLLALFHLPAPASAFGWFATSPSRVSASTRGGVLWLVAAILLHVAAGAVVFGAPWWWWPAIPAVAFSQLLIAGAWHDARIGTLATVVIAVPLPLAVIDASPSSFRSSFARDRAVLLTRPAPTVPAVSEVDTASQPPLYQTYLRRVGAAGRAHVRTMRVHRDVRMRASATAALRPLTNEIVVLAPAAVLDLPFTWSTTGARPVHAAFTNAGHTVAARPTFDTAGEPVGVLSIDRTQQDATGSRQVPSSSPIAAYREIDGVRVGSCGDAEWVESSGAWTSGEFTIRALACNVSQ